MIEVLLVKMENGEGFERLRNADRRIFFTADPAKLNHLLHAGNTALDNFIEEL